MADSASPNVHRRRLAVELRRERLAASITQREAAASLDWSLSKLVRIEAGGQGVSVTDLRALLDLYAITDPDRVSALTTAARGSRGQSWWSGYRDIVSSQFALLLDHESQAASLRVAQSFLIPGLLQTDEYAAALMTKYYDKARALRIIDLRMQRQERLFYSGAELLFILGEEGLHRLVGGSGVLRRQAEHLLDMGQRPNVGIRIVPFSAGSHPGLQGPFLLIRLKESDEQVLYAEDVDGSIQSIDGSRPGHSDPDRIALYENYFEMMTALALSFEDGNTLLRKLIDRLHRTDESKTLG